MEKSMNSISNMLSSNAKSEESPEESSWTFYIDEDFLCENGEFSAVSSGFDGRSFSQVSNLPEKMLGNHGDCGNKNKTEGEEMGFGIMREKHKQLNHLKKWKPNRGKVDDELEDTATSPMNSPKISYVSELVLNHNEKGMFNISSEVKRNTFGQLGVLGTVERNSNCTEVMKKRC